MAKWSTAEQNSFPDSSFAYVESGDKDSEGKTTPRTKRHLVYKDANGKIDADHVRDALARLDQTDIPAAAKASAKKKLDAAAKKVGIKTADSKSDGKKADRADAPDMATGAYMWAPITRVDAEKWEVTGVLTSEAVDTFGTFFDYESSKRAVEKWAGNLREQHDLHKAVGRRVDYECDDANKTITLTTRVSKGAPDTWLKVQDGTLGGFSVGAINYKTEKVKLGNRNVTKYSDFDYGEVSLVDVPSNPDAFKSGLTICRAAGGYTDEAIAALDDLDGDSAAAQVLASAEQVLTEAAAERAASADDVAAEESEINTGTEDGDENAVLVHGTDNPDAADDKTAQAATGTRAVDPALAQKIADAQAAAEKAQADLELLQAEAREQIAEDVDAAFDKIGDAYKQSDDLRAEAYDLRDQAAVVGSQANALQAQAEAKMAEANAVEDAAGAQLDAELDAAYAGIDGDVDAAIAAAEDAADDGDDDDGDPDDDDDALTAVVVTRDATEGASESDPDRADEIAAVAPVAPTILDAMDMHARGHAGSCMCGQCKQVRAVAIETAKKAQADADAAQIEQEGREAAQRAAQAEASASEPEAVTSEPESEVETPAEPVAERAADPEPEAVTEGESDPAELAEAAETVERAAEVGDAVTGVVEGDEEGQRKGARVSKSMRDKMHATRDAMLAMCQPDCDECARAVKAIANEGEDNEETDNDDDDPATRAVRIAATRAVEQVVASQVAPVVASLNAVLTQLRAVAIEIASAQRATQEAANRAVELASAQPVAPVVDLEPIKAEIATVAAAIAPVAERAAKIEGVETALAEIGKTVKLIAQSPQHGAPTLKPAEKVLGLSAHSVMDASLARSTGVDGDTLAALAKRGFLSQEGQIAAAAALMGGGASGVPGVSSGIPAGAIGVAR